MLGNLQSKWSAVCLRILLLSVSVSGCLADSQEVQPPRDSFFFPTALATSTDESVLFVANANSELRFDSGTILAIDLASVEELLDDWLSDTPTIPEDVDDCQNCCELDPSAVTAVVCSENRVLRDAAIRTGSFATDLQVQMLDSGEERLFVPVRGDPSITWIDYNHADGFSCGGEEAFERCNQDHKLTNIDGKVELSEVSSQPFEIYIDDSNGYGIATDLATGAITLIDAPAGGASPTLTDIADDVFPANAAGTEGTVGVTGRLPGSVGDYVYVTSRVDARVQMFSVQTVPGVSKPLLVSAGFFNVNDIALNDDEDAFVQVADDIRQVVFRDDGARAYFVARNPPRLQIVDTAIDAEGVPRNQRIGAVELCQRGSVALSSDVGEGVRVYVSCFSAGQVWVLDPDNERLVSIIDVGRGPHALAISKTNNRLFVGNVLEDTIAVIDIAPGSATEHRVVLRLGRTRQSGGE